MLQIRPWYVFQVMILPWVESFEEQGVALELFISIALDFYLYWLFFHEIKSWLSFIE